MSKLVILLLVLFVLQFGALESTTLQCNYRSDNWTVIQKAYFCYVQNLLNITTVESAHIEKAEGFNQENAVKNENVVGIHIKNNIVHYFPQELENVFKDLKAIEISDSELKVINQINLKPFANLIELNLSGNQLEVIEQDLFDFNSNLELINLSSNKISFIDIKVFDSLVNLKHLSLDSNICINMKTKNDVISVQSVNKALKSQCNGSEYLKILRKIQNIEMKSKSLSFVAFNEELSSLQETIKNSKFVNFFEQKLQALKVIQMKRSTKEISTASETFLQTSLKESSNFTAKLGKFQNSTKQNEKLKNIDNDQQKSDDRCPSVSESLSGVKNNIKDAVMRCTSNFAVVYSKFSSLNDTLLDVNMTVDDVKQNNFHIAKKLQVLEDNLNQIMSIANQKFDQIESNIEDTQKDMTADIKSEISKFEVKIDKKFEEIEEKLLKIMKVLKIVDN